jgi:hypothetical protein
MLNRSKYSSIQNVQRLNLDQIVLGCIYCLSLTHAVSQAKCQKSYLITQYFSPSRTNYKFVTALSFHQNNNYSHIYWIPFEIIDQSGCKTDSRSQGLFRWPSNRGSIKPWVRGWCYFSWSIVEFENLCINIIQQNDFINTRVVCWVAKFMSQSHSWASSAHGQLYNSQIFRKLEISRYTWFSFQIFQRSGFYCSAVEHCSMFQLLALTTS